jgi:predicted nuclease of predicted toxin-antitoxin system
MCWRERPPKDRILITTDTDFLTLLALSGDAMPSFNRA